ncbi:hypothetical protein A1OW_10460 [Enterovibrio norvegicus]|uniref:alpha/beta fold hydrolase n=1 Tax=Enterovibrio norvegicus TaxID=188144 RepID=UPI000368C67B|nr:alpha/beta hydrolase [Enterovibrio norvegicus]OEF50931.1 hypothetical protein A1OW_10460 [Enterovibrio norvegicus]
MMSDIISLNEQHIEYRLLGTESTVFIFLNGDGVDFQRSWNDVTSSISLLGNVLLFNRPGRGKSSKPVRAQTGDEIIETLNHLLSALKLAPPYILIGHSSGGLLANLYARRYPENVSGIVFVDPTHPKQLSMLSGHLNALQKSLLWTMKKLFPLSELNHLENTASMIEHEGAFPHIPIKILTSTKPDAPPWLQRPSMLRDKTKLHKEMTNLSPLNHHIFTANSGHFIPAEEPKIVIDAIRDLVKHL